MYYYFFLLILENSIKYCTYRKLPNNSRDVYLFQSLNRPGVYFGPGGNLGQAFNSFLTKIRDENVTNFASFSVNSLASFCEIVVRLLQVKLLLRRKRFNQPALAANSSSLLSLTVVCVCFAIALIILLDTLSWRVLLLLNHRCMFISNFSPAFFLPPPGSHSFPVKSVQMVDSLTNLFCRAPEFSNKTCMIPFKSKRNSKAANGCQHLYPIPN